MQIGLALPSILTAKIGVGGYLDREKKVAIIAGVRPWPLHVYAQVNLKEGVKGQWIMSYEAGSMLIDDFNFDTDFGLSLESLFIVNFGYRWTSLEADRQVRNNEKKQSNQYLWQTIRNMLKRSFNRF